MSKSILKTTFIVIIKGLSLVYSFKIHKKLNRFWNSIYTYWILPELGSIGDNPYIEKPVSLVGGHCITIGANFISLSRLRLECWETFNNEHYHPRLSIGDNVNFNNDCHIGCIHNIEIGNNVLLASHVFISDHSHGEIKRDILDIAPRERILYSKGPVIIEDNVWIGEGVIILPNVRIGRNAIIGANAVVSKDVPAFCVVGGIPASILKKL